VNTIRIATDLTIARRESETAWSGSVLIQTSVAAVVAARLSERIAIPRRLGSVGAALNDVAAPYWLLVKHA